MSRYNRILLIKPGALGDLLQLTPVVKALADRYPGAEISVMVGTALSADLFRYNPHVHETIVFDRKGEHRSWPAFIRLWKKIRAGRYDLIVNFQRSNLKAWLLASAALPCRILVYQKARGRIVHAVVNHLETLIPLGIMPDQVDHRMEFHPGSEALARAELMLAPPGKSGKLLVALNPGASHPVNRWSTAAFAELAACLVTDLRAEVILIGGDADVDLSREIEGRCGVPVMNLTGRTGILELGAVLNACSLLVSGDTGPLHMATAVGTPVVALFGAADPARTGPVGPGSRVIQAKGVACVPCRSRKCDHPHHLQCMAMIRVDDVCDTVRDLLKCEF